MRQGKKGVAEVGEEERQKGKKKENEKKGGELTGDRGKACEQKA